MAHEHKSAEEKELPFGGIILSICNCGARMRSDAKPISGMVDIDGSGWLISESQINKAEKDRRRALGMLETEGYGEEFDARDFLDSHHPDFQD